MRKVINNCKGDGRKNLVMVKQMVQAVLKHQTEASKVRQGVAARPTGNSLIIYPNLQGATQISSHLPASDGRRINESRSRITLVRDKMKVLCK